jgi:hypothetical protein
VEQAAWLIPKGASQLRDSTGIAPVSLRYTGRGYVPDAPTLSAGCVVGNPALESRRSGERELGVWQPGVRDSGWVDQVRELAHAVRDAWRGP